VDVLSRKLLPSILKEAAQRVELNENGLILPSS
jgi:hypothetical protein